MGLRAKAISFYVLGKMVMEINASSDRLGCVFSSLVIVVLISDDA